MRERTVKVQIRYETSYALSNNLIEEIVSEAKSAIEAEKKYKFSFFDMESSEVGFSILDEVTYNYTTFDDNNVFVYEESVDEEPTLTIYESVDTMNAEDFEKNSTDLELENDEIVDIENRDLLNLQTDFIPDGVGGRQKIARASFFSDYLSFAMTLPSSSQVNSNLNQFIPYNYGGLNTNLTLEKEQVRGLRIWV